MGDGLRAAGFTGAAVWEMFGGLEPAAVAALGKPALDRLSRVPSPLAEIVRLFVLGEEVERTVARRGLGSLWGLLQDARLLSESQSKVAARLRIAPYDDLVIASDRSERRGAVLGVEPSTINLAHLLPRARVNAALDLGTGGGVHALLVADRADAVVGTDIQARAIDMAWGNADMNAVQNVDFLRGTWYEPVAGREFDLVLGNLPFVIAPEAESVFEHAADPCGDSTTAHVIRAAPSHISDGGRAYFLGSWIVRDPRRWLDPLEDWLTGSCCDAVILRHGLQEASEYADARSRSRTTRHWRRAFDDAGIRWIAWGAIILRRRNAADANWIAGVVAPEAPGRKAAEVVDAMFLGADFLEACEPTDILMTRLRVAPGLRHSAAPVPWAGASPHYILDIDDGAGIHATTDELGLSTIKRLSDARDLLEAIPEEARATCAADVARAFTGLIAAGFLRPQVDGVPRAD